MPEPTKSYSAHALPFPVGGMRRVIGERRVDLVNPAAAIERQAEALLRRFDLQAEPEHTPQYDFMTSADETYRQRLNRQKRAGYGRWTSIKNAGASGVDNKNLKTGCNYGS